MLNEEIVKSIKLALAATLLLLLASCDQGGALRELVLKAEGGDASAQSILGRAYDQGNEHLGVPQDYVQSVNWFRKAAEQGDGYALRMLGIAYSRGEGVSRDYVQSARWFRKAAEQGDSYGQYWLGGAYSGAYNGLNKGLDERDVVLGYTWLNIAANGYSEDSAKLRDRVELELTPAQLAEAQRLSSSWRKGQSIQRENAVMP